MKTLEELNDKQKSAWTIMQDWFKQANNHYEILPRDVENAGAELVGMQLPTSTPLGAVIYETGGILIDHGWLRILGSGNEKLPRGLFEWNFGKTFEQSGERPFDDSRSGFVIADFHTVVLRFQLYQRKSIDLYSDSVVGHRRYFLFGVARHAVQY